MLILAGLRVAQQGALSAVASRPARGGQGKLRWLKATGHLWASDLLGRQAIGVFRLRHAGSHPWLNPLGAGPGGPLQLQSPGLARAERIPEAIG